MIIVLSPAKTLDFEPTVHDLDTSIPNYISQSATLINLLKKYSPSELSELMQISDKLAVLNVTRNASWSKSFHSKNSKPAILAFNGDVYEGLDAKSLNPKQLQFANDHLRILSGLYGILKPLDLMQAYRLEMGTALINKKGKDLYAFWGNSLTIDLKNELSQNPYPVLINLASEEYFKVIDTKLLDHEVISPVFLDEKDGKFKMISFYAKKARGLMARFLIEHQIKNPKQLVKFNVDGYVYCEEESSFNRPVFKRSASFKGKK